MEQLRLNARCDQLSSIYHVIIGATSLDKQRIWFISRITPCPECKVQAHCCKVAESRMRQVKTQFVSPLVSVRAEAGAGIRYHFRQLYT